jgi:lycopene cyclase domain-containing protein
VIPFVFSFHPKLNFYKTWYAFFPAAFISGVCFILWDIYFTELGIWGFNEQYLTGSKMSNLPVEEVLFFFCIPYACLFTYHCITLFVKKTMMEKSEGYITPILIVIFLFVAVINYNNIYPLYTFLILSIILFLAKYAFRIKWLDKFYIIYALLLVPFLIVNGILTGTGIDRPVVWYNEKELIGFRIFTIPLEDVFYGMLLFLVNLMIYHYLLERRVSNLTNENIPIKN